jgi:uncharacterized protein YjbI with pentapeptide repeats
MLFESVDFSLESPDLELGGSHVFRYCRFDKLQENQTGLVDSDFLNCTFKNCDFYWSAVPVVLFYACTFENCTFRGVSFRGCTFVSTSFTDCTFTRSNLGGDCSFDETKWFDCSQLGCSGLKGW